MVEYPIVVSLGDPLDIIIQRERTRRATVTVLSGWQDNCYSFAERVDSLLKENGVCWSDVPAPFKLFTLLTMNKL